MDESGDLHEVRRAPPPGLAADFLCTAKVNAQLVRSRFSRSSDLNASRDSPAAVAGKPAAPPLPETTTTTQRKTKKDCEAHHPRFRGCVAAEEDEEFPMMPLPDTSSMQIQTAADEPAPPAHAPASSTGEGSTLRILRVPVPGETETRFSGESLETNRSSSASPSAPSDHHPSANRQETRVSFADNLAAAGGSPFERPRTQEHCRPRTESPKGPSPKELERKQSPSPRISRKNGIGMNPRGGW